MRVVFEQLIFIPPTYECHLCGAWNKILSSSNSLAKWLTDGSLDWFVRRIR